MSTTNSPTNYAAVASDTISGLPDRPKMSAAELKAKFDKVSDDDVTTQFNAFLTALAGGSVALPVSDEDGTLTSIVLGDTLTADGKYAVTSAAIYAAIKNMDKVCWVNDEATYAGIKNAVEENKLVVFNPSSIYICTEVTASAARLIHFHGVNANGKMLFYVRDVAPNTTVGASTDTAVYVGLAINEPLNAVYGTTTYAEIASAWAANRIIKCRVNNVEYYCVDRGVSGYLEFTFACVRGDNVSMFTVGINDAVTVYSTPVTKYIQWAGSGNTSSSGSVEYIDFEVDSYSRISELVAADKALFGRKYGRTYSYGGIDDNSRHTFVAFAIGDVAEGATNTTAKFYKATCDVSNTWTYGSFIVTVTSVHQGGTT